MKKKASPSPMAIYRTQHGRDDVDDNPAAVSRYL